MDAMIKIWEIIKKKESSQQTNKQFGKRTSVPGTWKILGAIRKKHISIKSHVVFNCLNRKTNHFQPADMISG
jgi:hypothetical protein